MNGFVRKWREDCNKVICAASRGSSGGLENNEEVNVLLARLTDNVQLLPGSTPGPRARGKPHISAAGS